MKALLNGFHTIPFAVTVGLIVAAVPEGLPFIIGIITSQNVNRMIRSNILAKNPHKIPEAGNIQLLCTDKTGTLTNGSFEVTNIKITYPYDLKVANTLLKGKDTDA